MRTTGRNRVSSSEMSMADHRTVAVSVLLATGLITAGVVVWGTRAHAPDRRCGKSGRRTPETGAQDSEPRMRRVSVARSPLGGERGTRPVDDAEVALVDTPSAEESQDDAGSPWLDARACLIRAVDEAGIWCEDGVSEPWLLPPGEHGRALRALETVLEHYAEKTASSPERVEALSRELDMQGATQERRAARMATHEHDATCMSAFFDSAESIAEAIEAGSHRVAVRRRPPGTYSTRADVNSKALVFAEATLTVQFYKGEWTFGFALDEPVFGDGLWEDMSLARERVLETVK